MSNIEQRSEEWYSQRLGKFTASEIYKLMGAKGLGETGKSYAIEKAIEELFGLINENYISFDMQRGIDLEPLAFNRFKEIKDLDFITVESCGFIEFSKESGASPDGFVGENAILEIKCPKAETFFKLVSDGEVNKNYYYQMQMQMMASNRNKAYFFNYLVHEGLEFWHEIVIERDDNICDLICSRIAEASKIKQEYINKINTNKQWN